MLRGVTHLEMRAIAEKVCRLVAQSSLARGEDCIRLTISIGATMANGQDNAATLIQRADRALYMSKNGGRNCVTML
ncbi:hypothetical protein SDC9_163698 [bioreactor metagenome]|uniref:GGDEF domain-containing protein n=1 Tax=bioreactor metagenome TaxID=1076179 RepID=A0A645FSF2_9ZZZZ